MRNDIDLPEPRWASGTSFILEMKMMTFLKDRVRWCRFCLPITVLALLVLVPSEAIAQPAEAKLVSKSDVEELKSRIESSTDLDAGSKAKALEQIQLSTDILASLKELTANRDAFLASLETIEKRQRDLQNEIDAQSKNPPELRLPNSYAELKQRLSEKERDLAAAQAALLTVSSKIDERANQQRLLNERLIAIPLKREEAEGELTKLATSTDPPLLVEAKRQRLNAILSRTQLEKATIQAELSAADAEESQRLRQLQRQLQTDKITVFKKEVDSIKAALQKQWQLDVERRVEDARRAVEHAWSPELKEIYEENATIAEEEFPLRRQNDQVSRDIELLAQARSNLERDREQILRREERVGSSQSFGLRLREQRRQLFRYRQMQTKMRERVSGDEVLQLAYLDRRDQRRTLDDIPGRIEQLKSESVTTVAPDEDELEDRDAKLRRAFTQQREYLDELISGYDDHIEKIDSLSNEQSTLSLQIESFEDYISERILWIRSHEPLTPQAAIADLPTIKRIFDRKTWSTLGTYFSEDIKAAPTTYIFVAIISGLLIASLPFQRRFLNQMGKKAKSRLNTSLKPTNRAVFRTFLKTLVLPLPVLFLCWRANSVDAAPTVRALAAYFQTIAMGTLGFEFIRNVCRPYGLGQHHFGWSERANRLVSNQIALFLAVAIPMAMGIALLQSQRTDGSVDSIERVALVILYFMSMYMMHRLMSKNTGVMKEWVETHPESWLSQFSGVIYFISVATPCALACLTISGHFYAARQITDRLAATFFVLFFAVFIRSYLLRWLSLSQRRIAIEQARTLRDSKEEKEPDSSNIPLTQDQRSNLSDVGAQTRRLVNTTIVILTTFIAIWVWSDILPALNLFEAWKIPGTEITLLKIFKGLVAAILTTTAARNLPGLLEIVLLERLPLDRSFRYAVGALTQYVIVLIGILVVSDAIGLEWSSVQWLAAALTFGIGFGMQEIFANFVSGLIILFEQPVRVGDIVTIDGVSGVVSRIRIRSTTITDWDRKEYIVPNKEFITGKLLNWTLSDTINRVVIPVGVKYGSNPDQVREIILHVAEENEFVLADPRPLVTMEGFGASSLDFTLRAYLPKIELRLEAIHQLHTQINNALNEANIEIPFPQRDLNLRSIVPIATKDALIREFESAPVTEDSLLSETVPKDISSFASSNSET